MAQPQIRRRLPSMADVANNTGDLRESGSGNPFFDHPILNSPYRIPLRHWELDKEGQPTQRIVEKRRSADFITPIPKSQKQKKAKAQTEIVYDEGQGLSTAGQQYGLTAEIINEVRHNVDQWRALPSKSTWGVTPETARLLEHWRTGKFDRERPFFCQIEAAETAIWLTEVAPKTASGKRVLDLVKNANLGANPELDRMALKLATGAGKTTIMAMLIAWQTVNAVRHPGSKMFTKGFLVVTPGITIKDRLRVLLPNDAKNYYLDRQLVPSDMLDDVRRAKIVITNYHAFKLRETMDLSAGGRRFLKGRTGEDIQTLESEGQMLHRVVPELMGMKGVLVLNDEAHHCYREKPLDEDDESAEDLTGDDRKEAEQRAEAARLWISGIEAVNRKLGVNRVLDLSATPFFLSGSGYAEGTLFPWTVSDFSLMDAIESGIVKLPRVPIAENVPSDEMPIYRELWKHIGKDLPKKPKLVGEGRYDPRDLPAKLQTALEVLYGHYVKTYEMWEAQKIGVPPCFIIVCQNVAISKLVYEYVSGFNWQLADGSEVLVPGQLSLFQNYDAETGQRLARPNTLLIDSQQLEAGDALDDQFRAMAADEIEQFRREREQRDGQGSAANITDQDLLREVMNTVGKPGQLGAGIRCVVSVSMLTEGWDANTVTHVLGIRAFGTQLLCEQVIGRALRRQSYELNQEGLFDPEYADVFGIPFDFTAKPVVATPTPPRETVLVRAMRPERDALEISFPRIEGYRVDLPEERLTATFGPDSVLELTPELVGPVIVRNAGIVGEFADMSIDHLDSVRNAEVVLRLTARLMSTKWRDADGVVKTHLYGQLRRITADWVATCLKCVGDTSPALLRYQELSDLACNRIMDAITQTMVGDRPIRALLDPYNPTGSTASVHFTSSKTNIWTTDATKAHLNIHVLDSNWEGEFCRVAEAHPKVLAYVKNHNMGFEVPYRFKSERRTYIPDFIVLVDDGRGKDDPLHLIVEVKGYRGEDAKDKKATMDTYWVPGVNNLGTYGRWAFAECTQVHDFGAMIDEHGSGNGGGR